MSGKSSRAENPQNRTDTMIGAGMHVVGDIGFTGTLRIQGDVLGDVACDDAAGTVVVDATGSLTGALDAPRVVVRGRVIGPVRSSQSIDIQQGGTVVGDAFYRAIDVHGGGIVEGLLTPTGPVEAAPDGEREAVPPAGGEGPALRPGTGRMLAAAAVLIVAAAAAAWLIRTPEAPRAADAVSAEASSTNQAPPPAVPAANALPQAPRAVAEPAAAPAPGAGADAAAPSRDDPAGSAEPVMAVQGVNPAKPAGVFLLITREPVVLFRKKRQDGGEGRRIEVAGGQTVSVAIGRNEFFRIAEGRNVDIFYQGRKVAPKTIESGAWMSFVPQSSRAADEDR